MTRGRLPWLLLAVLVLAQIGYPLTAGAARDRLTVATVLLGWLLSVGHALVSRGLRTAAGLVLVTTGGGLAVEALGVATGFPFGHYGYSDDLGGKLAGVPLVIPLAWTWMAWPAWLAAVRLARPGALRVALAGLGLAAWDLFLDPQMVGEGYWSWRDSAVTLPGVPDVPVGNYLAWLAVAVVMMALLRPVAGPTVDAPAGDAPMYALYLWTYAASLLAHAVFLDLPASAVWGGLAMAPVALPLAVDLARAGRRHRVAT
ncbi:MAG TPA: carotenoid biosynthesis protein [Micromonospora sp.]